jgi:hypothetical protein
MIYFSRDAASDLERVREFLDIDNPEASVARMSEAKSGDDLSA